MKEFNKEILKECSKVKLTTIIEGKEDIERVLSKVKWIKNGNKFIIEDKDIFLEDEKLYMSSNICVNNRFDFSYTVSPGFLKELWERLVKAEEN